MQHWKLWSTTFESLQTKFHAMIYSDHIPPSCYMAAHLVASHSSRWDKGCAGDNMMPSWLLLIFDSDVILS